MVRDVHFMQRPPGSSLILALIEIGDMVRPSILKIHGNSALLFVGVKLIWSCSSRIYRIAN